MQHDPSDRQVHLVPAKVVSRRTIMTCTAKLVGGAALSVVAGARLAHVAGAQDNEIILTAAAAEVGARPGSAYARGYAAYAAGDQDAGATTQAATSPPPGAATSAAPTVGGTSDGQSGAGDLSVTEGTGSGRNPH
jgi:hypothetical protein